MKETILSLEKGAMERWRNGDPWGFVEITAEDIIYVDPTLSSPVIGLKKYKAYMRELEGRIRCQGSEFIDPRVVVVGDAAVLSYNYHSSLITPEGKTVSQTPWNATEVYFRREGGWQIAHTHWSYVRHKLPESVEVPVPVHLSRKEHDGILGEVMVLESAAMERWRKGDPWGFIEISDSEVSYFDAETPQRLNGRKALEAEYARIKGKIFYDVMDFIDPRVQVCGEISVLAYRFLSTCLNPDGSVSHRTPWNCTEVYVRVESRWRIVHTHWSYIKGERM